MLPSCHHWKGIQKSFSCLKLPGFSVCLSCHLMPGFLDPAFPHWRRAVTATLAGALLVLARGFSPEAGKNLTQALIFNLSIPVRQWTMKQPLCVEDAWEHILPVYGTPSKDPKARLSSALDLLCSWKICFGFDDWIRSTGCQKCANEVQVSWDGFPPPFSHSGWESQVQKDFVCVSIIVSV